MTVKSHPDTLACVRIGWTTAKRRGVFWRQMSPSRTPPAAVLRQLRKEVAFGCPVDACGCPYLTWHHFDPPWAQEKHHRPEGMIALCREHADKADHGAFTIEQLRHLKIEALKEPRAEVHGRFDWMRRDLLAAVGGNFYYRCPVIFELGNRRCIWFNRDDDGYLLLNFVMPSIAENARAGIEDNFWTVPTKADDIVCPPSGRLVEVTYPNGDRFRAEFSTAATADTLLSRYPVPVLQDVQSELVFPLTIVELWETVAGTTFEFGPRESRIGGITITGGFMADIGGAGIHVDLPPAQLATLFPRAKGG